jgi:hypothetical protein
MNEFIEQNKRLFKFYSSAAGFIGWSVLLTAICIVVIELLSGGRFIGVKGFSMRINMVWGLVFNFLLPVSLALLISQLIRYITEPEYHYGWILRYGDNILYVYAALVVLNSIWQHIFYFVISHSDYGPSELLYVFITVLLTLAKVLILVGFGQILKRIMPIIEEHKSLV